MQMAKAKYCRAQNVIIAAFAVIILVAAGGCVSLPTTDQPQISASLNSDGFQIDDWNFAGVSGIKITSPRYHLFSTARDDVALKMASFLEAAADQYDKLTGLGDQDGDKPREKMKVYLLASRQQWAALTKKITGNSSGAALKIRAGGYCVNGVCVFWDIGTVATARVAVHEGLHQYLYHRLYHRLPDWADEALAVSSEGFELDGVNGHVTFDTADNHNRYQALRDLIFAGRMKPLKQLVALSSMDNIDTDPLHAADYYGQLWALAEMLRSDSRYSDAFDKMCKSAARGHLRSDLNISRRQWSQALRQPSIYARITGMSCFIKFVLDGDQSKLAEFEREYILFARKLAKID